MQGEGGEMEVRMTNPTNLGEAFIFYGVNLIVYGIVAITGVMIGIRLRKRKNRKEGE